MENLLMQGTTLSFQDLRKLEFTVAAELNKLRNYIRSLNLTADIITPIDDVLQRIQSQSFAIAVVGEFKRGKSTFINALLGQEILPSDIAPTSATLNRVTYGTKPAVQVIFKAENGNEEQIETIGIEQLANYVTKLTPEAEQVAAKVKEAVVYYPSRFCQNNVSIIDTPGLSDDISMTEITLSVLPKVDAAILVIRPEAPFSGSEGKFLSEHLLHNLEHVFFVVTAIDQLRHVADQERVINFVTSRIEEVIKLRTAEIFGQETQKYQDYLKRIGKPKVFGLSGYNALQGKLGNNHDLIVTSRIHAFESALEKFLTEERGLVTLEIAADRLYTTSIAVNAYICEQQKTIQTQQAVFDAACASAFDTLTDLHKMYTEEIQAIHLLPESVYARIQLDLTQLVENLNRVAAAVIEEANIVYSDLNQATVGAVSDAFSNLADQIPADVQANVRKGWSKLLERLPRNIQDSSTDTWKKVVKNIPENVQNLGKAPAIEQLAQQLTITLQTVGELEIVKLRDTLRQEWSTAQTGIYNFDARADQVIGSIVKTLTGQEYTTIAKTVATAIPITIDLSLFIKLNHLDISYQQIGLKAAAISKFSDAQMAVKNTLSDVKKMINQPSTTNSQELVDQILLFKSNLKKLLAEEVMLQLAPHLDRGHILQELTESLQKTIQYLKQQLDNCLSQIKQTEQALHEAKQRNAITTQRKLEELMEVQRAVLESGAFGARLSKQLTNLLGN